MNAVYSARPAVTSSSQGHFISIPCAIALWVAATPVFAEPPRTDHVGDAVFLATDQAAIKKLATARDLLSASQWSDALDLIQQVRQRHANQLIDAGSGRYLKVQTYCDLVLSGLPADGLKAYRARVDPQVRKLFELGQATLDEELLRQVLERGFHSSYGGQALRQMGAIAWERGDFTAARRCWSKLLPRGRAIAPGQVPSTLVHADTRFDPAQLRAELALCSVFERHFDRARTELRELQARSPDAQGHLAGRNGRLVEILDQVLAEQEKAPAPTLSASLSTFACNPQRNALVPASIDPGAPQWMAPLPGAPVVRASRLLPGLELPEQGGTSSPVTYPIVAGGRVFLSDDETVYTLDLQSGQPAWDDVHAAASADVMTRAAVYRLPEELALGHAVRPSLPPGRNTLTFHEGRLFARLGSLGIRSLVDGREAVNFLVCLDIEQGEGKPLWLLRSNQIELEGGNWTFDGSPVGLGDRIYVPLYRARKPAQAGIACLDAPTGRVIWVCMVCSGFDPASTSGVIEAAETRQQLLTLGEGRLYYNTNRGAVACLNLAGQLEWVTLYPQQGPDNPAAYIRRLRYGPNPCVYHAGQVFVTPVDSEQILALDAENGILQWDFDLRGQTRALLGVNHGRLMAAGDWLVALRADTGQVAWHWDALDPESFSHGRGLLAGDVVFWPQRDCILVLDQVTGRRTRQPIELSVRGLHGIDWQMTGGNLLIADGLLLIAQSHRLVALSAFSGPRPAEMEVLGVSRARRAVPRGVRLEHVLCYQETRRVQNDWTVSWCNRILQLSEQHQKLALAGKTVLVSELLDGTLRLTHRGRELSWKELSARPPRARRQPGGTGESKAPHKPAANHPWRNRRSTK